MNHLRYRLETLPAALNARKMPREPEIKSKVWTRGAWLAAICLVVAGIVLYQTKRPAAKLVSPTLPVSQIKAIYLRQLADARIDTAKAILGQNRPDEALSLLVTALKDDLTSGEALAMADMILSETTWNYPEITLPHPMPVDQLATAGPSSLWVSLDGKSNTTVRWNLDTLEIESVLFPTAGGPTRSLVFDPNHRSVVVERNSLMLLCDAKSLMPIRDLGPLPADLTPSSVIVFTRDGLLMAHPTQVSAEDPSIIWQIRDTTTGEMIRRIESAPEAPRPVAAFMERKQLRVLAADGSLTEIPLSPVDPLSTIPMDPPLKLLQAQFATNGNSVLALQDMGQHQIPDQSIISYSDDEDSSLDTEVLALRFPWSRHPNMWTGLMKDPKHQPFVIERNTLKILTNPHAPMVASAGVSALAFHAGRVFIGEENGVVTAHRLLPLPSETASEAPPAPLDVASLRALTDLTVALTGRRFDETERTFPVVGPEDRAKAFADCDFDRILAIFPHLDFSPIIRDFHIAPTRQAPAESFKPLHTRLANAGPPEKSAPGLAEVKAAFHSGDPARVTATIQTSGSNGPALATALALALQSETPDWIRACVSQATDLPPLLLQISRSRIAWLEGRKADALAPWPEVFPDLSEIRLREDWDGWEQADFSSALESLKQGVGSELAAIRIPKESTPEQRRAVADRLSNPTTIAAVGKTRFALACMDAAITLSANCEEYETTAKFANLARNLGAPAVPCLRAEAVALTALRDFKNARSRWVELITEHPRETHLPTDYTEAAYTAFEEADSRQAIEILTTGLRRFPRDADFALKAGWVALLTGNSERAYKFLLAGRQTGFPPEKLENATALLCIAASQSGATGESSTYFDELLAMDPTWENPETLDALDWPEELKSTLREFSLVALTPDPSLGPFPTNP
jgi:tetratricopeptide (TPR) repeat protein